MCSLHRLHTYARTVCISSFSKYKFANIMSNISPRNLWIPMHYLQNQNLFSSTVSVWFSLSPHNLHETNSHIGRIVSFCQCWAENNEKKLFLKPCKYLFPFFVVEIKVSSWKVPLSKKTHVASNIFSLLTCKFSIPTPFKMWYANTTE